MHASSHQGSNQRKLEVATLVAQIGTRERLQQLLADDTARQGTAHFILSTRSWFRSCMHLVCSALEAALEEGESASAPATPFTAQPNQAAEVPQRQEQPDGNTTRAAAAQPWVPSTFRGLSNQVVC